MYPTSKQQNTSSIPRNNETSRIGSGDPIDDATAPIELETWTIDELDDVLPAHRHRMVSEFELYWDRSAPLEQIELYLH